MKNTLEIARDIISSLPPAISGQGGHPATFRAACECVRLGLSDGDALSLLQEFNRRSCSPPWTEKELRHKLTDARRAAGGQVRRWHRPAAATAVRVVWRSATRPMAAPPPAPPPPMAPPPLVPEPSMPDFCDLNPGTQHMAGWHRDGTPIFRGTVGEWRAHFQRI
jgi:hypothetical protein